MGTVMQNTKPPICQSCALIQVEFLSDTEMKELSLVFLQKTDMQQRGSSVLIALFGFSHNLVIIKRHVPVGIFPK